MRASVRHVVGMAVLALAAGHCSGSTNRSGPGSSTDGAPNANALEDSGLCEGTAVGDGAVPVPAEHRPAATTCPLTQPLPTSADGGAFTCDSAADCAGDATPAYEGLSCLNHQCADDECLSDSDCGAGTVCLCSADAGGGDVRHLNACVPAACAVDSDCGPNEYCSPNRTYCGEVTGYYCHGVHDTCVDPTTDCACLSGEGKACIYAPQVGYWVCGQSVCLG